MVGRSALIAAIEEDFELRHPGYHKSRRGGLTTLAGVMLEVRSGNLMELAAALPRDIGTADHRYQYIERQLANPAIEADAVIRPYALEVMERLAVRGQTIILQIDQSHINDTNEVLMVSVRLRKRAVPVAWRVRSTQGNIDFSVQKELLDSVRSWLPSAVSVLLAGDRFYGTAALVGWCRAAGWSYRIRLKGNLTLAHQGGELTTGEVVTRLPEGVNPSTYGSFIHYHLPASRRTESVRSRFPILRHLPGSEPLSTGETAWKTSSFPGVCEMDSGLRERNERPNLSPKGQFSPRPGAMGVSGPGWNALKLQRC